jgi:hypothetical protein
VAQLRGDDDAALDWYNKSLAISEQLGDRAKMATTISQMGILHTEKGRAADGVPLNLQSLALRLEIGSPNVPTDLYWLSRQRSMLGADAFCALVATHGDAESLTSLLALLDQFDAAQQEAAPAAPPPAASAQPERGFRAALRRVFQRRPEAAN